MKQRLVTASATAKQIRACILKETGLTASAGICYNKFLAKLASSQRKPNRQFVITPEMGPDFIASPPVASSTVLGLPPRQRCGDAAFERARSCVRCVVFPPAKARIDASFSSAAAPDVTKKQLPAGSIVPSTTEAGVSQTSERRISITRKPASATRPGSRLPMAAMIDLCLPRSTIARSHHQRVEDCGRQSGHPPGTRNVDISIPSCGNSSNLILKPWRSGPESNRHTRICSPALTEKLQ
jgi:hypothetical protein